MVFMAGATTILFPDLKSQALAIDVSRLSQDPLANLDKVLASRGAIAKMSHLLKKIVLKQKKFNIFCARLCVLVISPDSSLSDSKQF